MQPYCSTNPHKSGNQYIFDGKGHRVANVEGRTLFRTIHERHIPYSPKGISFDLVSLDTARRMGVEIIVIHRLDIGVKMLGRLEDYFTVGIEVNFGWGIQRVLPLEYFQVIQAKPSEKVEQFALPLGI
jgi:hypothetical protein